MKEESSFKATNHIKIYKKGSIIFSEGKKGREMYVILKGEIEITKMIHNESHTLSILKPGSFFGEMSTIRGSDRVATATAHSDVECLQVSPDTFKKMLQDKPGFGIKVIKELCNRIEAANKQIEKLTLLNQTERIIVILTNLATNYGSKPFKSMKIKYDIALTEIANKTKFDPKTVEKIVVTLARYGKMEVVDENDTKYINLTDKLLKT